MSSLLMAIATAASLLQPDHSAFVAIGQKWVVGSGDGRAWVSDDKGYTFVATGAGLRRAPIRRLLAAGDRAWACTPGGVFSLGDDLVWHPILDAVDCRAMAIGPKSAIVVSPEAIHSSGDGGATWKAVKPKRAAETLADVEDAAIAPGSEQAWLVARSTHVIDRTTDRGKTFERVFTPPPEDRERVLHCSTSRYEFGHWPKRKGVLRFVVDAKRVIAGPLQWWCELSGKLPFEGGFDLLSSNNGGKSFKSVHIPRGNASARYPEAGSLVITPDGTLRVGAFGRVDSVNAAGERTGDWWVDGTVVGSGESGWPIVTRDSIRRRGAGRIVLRPEAPSPLTTLTSTFLVENDKLFRRPKGGHGVDVTHGIVGNIVSLGGNDQRLLVATDAPGLFTSRNGGLSWQSAPPPTAWPTGVVAAGDEILVAGVEGLFAAADEKGPWNRIASEPVFGLARLDEGRIIVGGRSGTSTSLDGSHFTPVDPDPVRAIVALSSARALVVGSVGAGLMGSDGVLKKLVKGAPARPFSKCVAGVADMDILSRITVQKSMELEEPVGWCTTDGFDAWSVLAATSRFRSADWTYAPIGAVDAVVATPERVLVAAQLPKTDDSAPRLSRLIESRDSGQTWQHLQTVEGTFTAPTATSLLQLAGRAVVLDGEKDKPVNVGTGSCAMDPKDPKSIFCNSGAPEAHGLSRSVDGGVSFKIMGKGRGGGIAFSPVDSNVVFAGTWRSVDGGWTFAPIWPNDAPGGNLLAVLSDGAAIVEMGSKSMMGGSVFRVEATGAPTKIADRLSLERCVSSADGGLTCLSPIPRSGPTQIWVLARGTMEFVRKGSVPFPVRGFAVDGSRLFASNIGIWKSNDMGETWALFDGALN